MNCKRKTSAPPSPYTSKTQCFCRFNGVIRNYNTTNTEFLKRIDTISKQSTGRSMIEMIGVLAIIGLLSIGGLAGYTIAMNYYKANETIYDVML